MPRQNRSLLPALPLRLVTSLLLLAAAAAAHADIRLVMFRHGEKPAEGLGQLDCRGLNRALALPKVLLAAYGRPAGLYAPDPGAVKDDLGRPYNYIRPLATIEPTAIRLGMPVNTRWAWHDIVGLQAELLRPEHDGQTLFVAWEHHKLQTLARSILQARGADPAQVPAWRGADFDSIYVLTLPSQGGATLKVEAQGLDGLSTACPGG